MFNKIIYILVIVATLFLIGGIIFFYEFGNSFVRSNEDLREPACGIHERGRMDFHLNKRGYDLDAMIDSFVVINAKYKMSDSLAIASEHGHAGDCQCCCIDNEKEIFLPGTPIEVYRYKIERYRYHAGFEGQYFDNIGYIDIISTYKNGKWSCSLTSKLDSAERIRVRKRFDNEVLSHLPMIRDTSSHTDEAWLGSPDNIPVADPQQINPKSNIRHPK